MKFKQWFKNLNSTTSNVWHGEQCGEYILWLNFIVGLNFIFISAFLGMIMNGYGFKRKESINIT